jgi:hypothetical protein
VFFLVCSPTFPALITPAVRTTEQAGVAFQLLYDPSADEIGLQAA